MKKALNILILVIVIIFLSNVSFSQTANSNLDDLAFTSQNDSFNQQNSTTLEEVPTSALPSELINRIVLSYEKPSFKKAFQVVESGKVVGYEVEFISNSKYNILRYQLKN